MPDHSVVTQACPGPGSGSVPSSSTGRPGAATPIDRTGRSATAGPVRQPHGDALTGRAVGGAGQGVRAQRLRVGDEDPRHATEEHVDELAVLDGDRVLVRPEDLLAV